ncbi:MAG TPA: response regulator transcription factor [Candidatus Paceibacterota bacterium]|nr:response regulator transcription factor [Candidatus Paceibacterota bacterium]
MRVLLVEDNERLALSTKKGLEQEGYAVDVMHDGLQAEKRLSISSKEYDICILDVMLPGKDGISVCKALRAKSISLPIIMVTAKDTKKDTIAGLDAGADDYLLKPFSFEEMLARLRALLRRQPAMIPATFTVGALVVDTNQKIATINGSELPLTVREFGVLDYLLRNSNQVVSREQLLEHLWDYSFEGFSNVVDAHIKNLRKKLGRYENNIQTIRGVGYRFTC